jgi:hypothetical protein
MELIDQIVDPSNVRHRRPLCFHSSDGCRHDQIEPRSLCLFQSPATGTTTRTMISIAPISSLIGQPALASPSIVTVQLKRTLAWCGRPAVQPGTQRGQAAADLTDTCPEEGDALPETESGRHVPTHPSSTVVPSSSSVSVPSRPDPSTQWHPSECCLVNDSATSAALAPPTPNAYRRLARD